MAINSVNPAQAASLYANTQKAASATGMEAKPNQPSFGDLMREGATQAVDTMRAGEKVSAQAVLGKASMPEVVQAVTAAETTLQTVVAVRDRMMSAYQEIMRMPI